LVVVALVSYDLASSWAPLIGATLGYSQVGEVIGVYR
jgi:hypothetical protein